MGRLAGRASSPTAPPRPHSPHYTRWPRWISARASGVNAIAPGSILTSALDIVASNDELRTPMEKVTPMRRLGDPEDIAAAAVYLASPAGKLPDRQDARGRRRPHLPNLDLPIPDL